MDSFTGETAGRRVFCRTTAVARVLGTNQTKLARLFYTRWRVNRSAMILQLVETLSSQAAKAGSTDATGTLEPCAPSRHPPDAALGAYKATMIIIALNATGIKVRREQMKIASLK